MEKNAIILSLSSDIGYEIASDWLSQGYNVFGTYRHFSDKVSDLKHKGAHVLYCNLNDINSLDKCVNEMLLALNGTWDVLLIASGNQDPVGRFSEINLIDWVASIQSNFTSPMMFLHKLLGARSLDKETQKPSVIFFAGGGTNDAPQNYSSYIISKIALIKATEILDSEMPDVKFIIIGPGWVKTKTHQPTLSTYQKQAGANYQRTLSKLSSDECVPIQSVIDCVNWAIAKNKDIVGGRNISLVYDMWETDSLDELLLSDDNIYKLRRFGNELKVNSSPISEKSCE